MGARHIQKEHRELARGLRRKKGVVAVFVGLPRRAGVWVEGELALSVHVIQKQSPEHLGARRRIPGRVDGLFTDVIESGRPRTQDINVGDLARAQKGRGDYCRESTLGAVAAQGDTALILLSGHATLPYRADGKILRNWWDNGQESGNLALDDDPLSPSARTWMGRLERGSFGGDIDYALARFPEVPIDTFHPAGQRRPPFPTRESEPSLGETLVHWSRLGPVPGLRRGRVVGSLIDSIDAQLGDQTTVRYTEIFCVAPEPPATHFSLPGDSGSLVFDLQGRAAGFIVAGTESCDVSYLLPVRSLEPALCDEYRLFFDAP